MKKAHDQEVAALRAVSAAEVERLQRQSAVLQASVQQSEHALQKAQQSTQQWAHVALELRMLYEQVSRTRLADYYDSPAAHADTAEAQHASLSNMAEHVIVPNPDDLEMLVRALSVFVATHEEVAASKAVREYTGIANTLWLRHFSNRPALRFNPRGIFSALSHTVSTQDTRVAEMRGQLERVRFELQQLRVAQDQMAVENRRLQHRISAMEDEQRQRTKESVEHSSTQRHTRTLSSTIHTHKLSTQKQNTHTMNNQTRQSSLSAAVARESEKMHAAQTDTLALISGTDVSSHRSPAEDAAPVSTDAAVSSFFVTQGLSHVEASPGLFNTFALQKHTHSTDTDTHTATPSEGTTRADECAHECSASAEHIRECSTGHRHTARCRRSAASAETTRTGRRDG